MVVWFTFLTGILTAKKANIKSIRNIKYPTFADNFSDFSSFIFKVPEKNVVIGEEEFHGIEIDSILNLENLSRTVLFD